MGEYFTATLLQLLFTLTLLVMTMTVIMILVFTYVVYYSVCSITYCVCIFFVSVYLKNSPVALDSPQKSTHHGPQGCIQASVGIM